MLTRRLKKSSKGSLKVGKLADVTVLSKDILTIPEDEIPLAQVDYTIVGGKVMYQRGSVRTGLPLRSRLGDAFPERLHARRGPDRARMSRRISRRLRVRRERFRGSRSRISWALAGASRPSRASRACRAPVRGLAASAASLVACLPGDFPGMFASFTGNLAGFRAIPPVAILMSRTQRRHPPQAPQPATHHLS